VCSSDSSLLLNAVWKVIAKIKRPAAVAAVGVAHH